MKTTWFAALLAILPAHQALAWGQEGHSVVAEIAQRRLSPQATAAVARLLGAGDERE
ncbi:MAG: Nuclease, partial [Alphaproteobacteria bacterium]|nr:Nuclease [Alphaproteobacteria bacterium]